MGVLQIGLGTIPIHHGPSDRFKALAFVFIGATTVCVIFGTEQAEQRSAQRKLGIGGWAQRFHHVDMRPCCFEKFNTMIFARLLSLLAEAVGWRIRAT
jgi:hypothetical protein